MATFELGNIGIFIPISLIMKLLPDTFSEATNFEVLSCPNASIGHLFCDCLGDSRQNHAGMTSRPYLFEKVSGSEIGNCTSLGDVVFTYLNPATGYGILFGLLSNFFFAFFSCLLCFCF
jgi:hypothetical protein